MCGRFFFFSLVLLTLQIVFKKCCPLFSCLPSVWIGALRHSCEQLSCRSAAKRLSLFSLSIVSFFFFLILTARNWTKMCRLAPSLRFFHLYLVFPIMWGAHFFFFLDLTLDCVPESLKQKREKDESGREGTASVPQQCSTLEKKKKGSRTRCAVLFTFFMFVLSDEVHLIKKKNKKNLPFCSFKERKKRTE